MPHNTPSFLPARLLCTSLALLLASITTPLLAQNRGTAPPMPSRRGARAQPAPQVDLSNLHIQVNTPDNQPLPGAELLMVESGSLVFSNISDQIWHQTLTTDDKGQIAPTLRNSRPITIIARASGYPPLFIRSADITRSPVFTITLLKGRSFKGIIRNNQGQPLADVTLKANRDDVILRDTPDFHFDAISKADGTFEFTNVALAKYTLTVTIPSNDGAWFAPPSSILIGPSQEAPCEITAEPGAVIKGQVTAPPSMNLAAIQLSAMPRAPINTSWRIPVFSDGHFEACFPPHTTGRLIVFAANRGPDADYYPLVQWPTSPPAISVKTKDNMGIDVADLPAGIYEGCKIDYLKFAHVKGIITDEAGNPVQGADIFPPPYNSGRRSAADGSYDLQVPPRISTHLHVTSANGVNAFETLDLPNMVLEPEQVIEKNITVKLTVKRPYDQSISGRLLGPDGQPVSGAALYISNGSLVPQLMTVAERNAVGPGWNSNSTKSSAGNFNFTNLYAGTTDIWAYEPALGWGYLREIKTGANEVEIKLALQAPPITIAGQILDADAKPLANAPVYFLTGLASQKNPVAQTQTDASGHFSSVIPPPTGDISRTTPPSLVLVCRPAQGAVAWKQLPRMSIPDLKIQLDHETSITGRVLDDHDSPLAGATVSLQIARHPIFGSSFFGLTSGPGRFDAAPSTTTDAQGRYALRGIPENCSQLQVGASSPNYSGNGRALLLAQPLQAPDLVLNEAPTVEGTVIRGDTSAPVPNATVALQSGLAGGQPITMAANSKGYFRFPLQALDGPVSGRIDASSGSGDAMLSGSALVPASFILNRSWGENYTVEIPVFPAPAIRLAPWKAKPAPTPVPAPSILVLEGPDQSSYFANRNGPHSPATLTAYDPAGKQLWQFKDFQMNYLAGKNQIAIDPNDKSIWVFETAPGSRILKIKPDGTQDLELPGMNPQAIAVDASTSNLWIATSNSVLVLDARGKTLHSLLYQEMTPGSFSPGTTGTITRAAPTDVAYNPFDKSIWVTSTTLQKFAPDAELLAQCPFNFPLQLSSLVADASDGSIWALENPDPLSSRNTQRYLVRASHDALPNKEIPANGASTAIDSARKVVWSCSPLATDLTRCDLNGKNSTTIPLPATNLALEPATGCLWAATSDALYRIDPAGNYISTIPSPATGQKLIAIIP